MSKNTRMAVVAWTLTAVYYFYQYTMRSSPSVMMSQLTEGFGLSALLGPVFAWLLTRVSGQAEQMEYIHYQTAFLPLLAGVGLAILLTFKLKETGPAFRK